MVTIKSSQIKKPSQVEALKDAGVITAAQAKKLLAGLKPPKAKVTQDAGAARTAARQAVGPKNQEKVPAGFIAVDRRDVEGKNFAFSKLASAANELYYYLPMDRDLEGRSGPSVDLLKKVRDVAAGVVNFMTAQQVMAESDDYRKGIWSPGDTGFHPKELEARLAKAIKPFGLTLETLPNAIRMAAMEMGFPKDTGTHDTTERAFNAANQFQNRNNNEAWLAAKAFAPLGLVNGRSKSWALETKPAADGMLKLNVAERPGTPAPNKTEARPAWVDKKMDALDYSRFDPSLPAGFGSSPAPSVSTPVTSTVSSGSGGVSARAARDALGLGRQLQDVRDPNLVPRNVSLADINKAVANLRTGAEEVAAAVAGTRGSQANWGGELVAARDLTALADKLEILAARMGGGPAGASSMAADKALALGQKLEGITQAERVPRNISRADVESAAARLSLGASEVERAVAGTRGIQTTWGGKLVSAFDLRGMAEDLQVLALKMRQAGY